MRELFTTPSHWNLRGSAFSANILHAEYQVEEFLHIWQTPQERRESYSFLKGAASTLVKVPFAVVGAVASTVEMVVRLVLSGIALIFAQFHEGWNEVPGNLLSSAVSTNCSADQWSALVTFIASASLPFSEAAYAVPKIWQGFVNLSGRIASIFGPKSVEATE